MIGIRLIIILCILYIILDNNVGVLMNDMYCFRKHTNRFYINYNDYNKFYSHKKTLYIISHECEHIDVFIMQTLFKHILQHNYHFVLDNNWHNKILEYYQMRYKNINCMFTRTGVVQKSINILNQSNDNVVLWLYDFKNSSGSFNIYKNTDCKIVLVKINCNDKLKKNHLNSNIIELLSFYVNKQFTIQIEDFNTHLTNNEDFLTEIKNRLYT